VSYLSFDLFSPGYLPDMSLLISLFTVSFAFASPVTATDAAHQEASFSMNTVITENNINDILKYYGLDSAAIIQNDKPFTNEVTVRDLEKAIKIAQKLPNTITIYDDKPYKTKVSTNNITIQETGIATVSRNATITSSLIMNYSATGRYYKSSTTKYWTEALGANIQIASDSSSAPYYYQVDTIHTLTNKVVNAWTSDSYLQMDYDYDVGFYFGFNGYGIRLSSTNVEGYSRFFASSIP